MLEVFVKLFTEYWQLLGSAIVGMVVRKIEKSKLKKRLKKEFEKK